MKPAAPTPKPPGAWRSGTPGEVADEAVIEACETLANIRQFHDDDVRRRSP